MLLRPAQRVETTPCLLRRTNPQIRAKGTRETTIPRRLLPALDRLRRLHVRRRGDSRRASPVGHAVHHPHPLDPLDPDLDRVGNPAATATATRQRAQTPIACLASGGAP